MRAGLLGVALALVLAAPAAAAPQLVKIGDFDQPVHVASPPRATQLYVVEKSGTIELVGGGTFLDVTSITDDDGERGLLSMAFSPNYASDGLFYVFLTATGGGDLKVLEFQRSAANPSRANPAPRRELLSIDHPNPLPYHNGGQLQIGPDGMLYVSTGEGHDSGNAQNVSSLLGKILRLDPATGGAAAGNPHGRVWAYGLRNPWRFSFDRLTGDMAIGDVGADSWEEINWAPAPGRGSGMDFGWADCEGPDPSNSCGEDPIIAHNHNAGFRAIVGGYVIRDPGLPTLRGRYIYGDNADQRLWSAVPRTGADDKPTGLEVPLLTSFGEDACGHVYAASLNGPVYRLQDGAVSPCSFAGQPAPDTAPPGLAVGLGGVRKLLRNRRLTVSVRCSEACQVAIGTRLRNVRRLATRRRTLAAQERKVVRLKLRKATMKRLRKRIRRRGFVRIAVSVRATDGAGNVATATRRGRVKRRR